MADVFNRFAPLVQEYIYTHGWKELRSVQKEAAEILFDSDAHLLVSSATASGKTEAVFFPIISDLIKNPMEGFSVLYIAPLKSLINDQFERLTELLDMSEIPLYHWHGDVASSHKAKALKQPRGILQITPESLESMLINRQNDIPRLFAGLRYIVIDEVHSLMDSDRGRQVQCQLVRLDRLMPYYKPRRIGLSATVGDKTAVMAWLAAGSERAVRTTASNEERPLWRLGIEHFYIQNDKILDSKPDFSEFLSDGSANTSLSSADLPQKEIKVGFDPGYEYVYRCTEGKSCLVFSNSREETESVTAALRQLAERRGEPDRFLIHHGNLSAALREETEEKMKSAEEKFTACATVTLELGIDIGRLERIIQLDAPNTVSSFLQRLGRSGRQNAPPEMMTVIREEEPLPNAPLPQIIPYRLLQAIAVIQLYLEEKFIEVASPPKMPMSLLFEETLSVLASTGELSPAALAGRVLTLPPFLNVEKTDYRTLLRAMVEEDYISLTEEGGLIVGLEGEKLTSSFKFYATFKDSEDFTVRWQSDEIGTISSAPPIGERFALAGKVWEVEESDLKRRLIYVHPVKGRMEVSWPGDYGEIHTKILERMRLVLEEDTIYPYLKPQAVKRLEAARAVARNTGLLNRPAVRLGGYSYCIFPWLGTRSFRAFRRMLVLHAKELGVSGIEFEGCYYLSFKMNNGSEEDICPRLLALMEQYGNAPEGLVFESECPSEDKYDPLIPPELLRKSYALDRLNVKEAMTRLRELSEMR